MSEARAGEHADPRRRNFLSAAAAGMTAAFLPPARGEAAAQPPAFEFQEDTLRSLGERMARGEVTAERLVETYLARIGELDRGGPGLRAVLTLNPDALAIAATLDRERAAGRARGPLHGIPLLLKDNIPTGDRMATTAGSLALQDVRCKEDAPLVRRLREAGAVILGKSNLSEWANFRSTHSLSGWSSLGGQTRNPYALDRSPSGSSSGSAVAVAANLCAAAIGTETDGSIVSPSACNNVAALKPSIGFVSRTALIPISRSQDTAGPMGRTVEDCALVMNAIAGPDAEDLPTTASAVPRNPDFTAFLGAADLKGVRLGFLKQYSGVNERADRVIGDALHALRALGAEIVAVEVPAAGRIGPDEVEVLFHEFHDGIDRWLARYAPQARVRSLADLIEFNARNADRVMPLFGQDAFIAAFGKPPLTDPKYRAARVRARQTAREGVDTALGRNRLDALVSVSSQLPWLLDPVNGDATKGGCTPLAAVSGYPHVTVPAGFAEGLPVGLSIIGTAFSDARLLGIAHVFERATKHRRAPTYPQTVARI
jgi:amidase